MNRHPVSPQSVSPELLSRQKVGEAGITLLELLISMAIAGMVISAAIPDFSQVISRHRANTDQRLIEQGLRLARRQAIQAGHPVAVCPTSDGVVCGASPSRGLMVKNLDQVTHLVMLEAGSRIHWNFGLRGIKEVSFDPFGHAPLINASVIVCSGQGAVTQTRRLRISRSGRISADQPDAFRQACPA